MKVHKSNPLITVDFDASGKNALAYKVALTTGKINLSQLLFYVLFTLFIRILFCVSVFQ